ncbi:MAG: hypothetical protein ACO2Y2_01025 [Poseidonia sp.]
MPAIRYGIAGRPVDHSLSPLLTALVARHLGIALNDKQLTMELVDVKNIPDALAWGYAGAVPEPIPWVYTGAVFGKFRTKALLKKALEAASMVDDVHPLLVGIEGHTSSMQASPSPLPTRMFQEEIWLNLTAPLKHQLDSSAVVAVDDSMANKCVNALRWDGRGWWCAGLDGAGVADVLHHHGYTPSKHVLGLVGGGGAARSSAAAWARLGGRVHQLKSRRMFDEGSWMESITDQRPDIVVDFDHEASNAEGQRWMCSAYGPMEGDVHERAAAISEDALDGRWLLVAQHLACWRVLWAPERAEDLPSLGLLLTRLLEAESLLASYA